MSPSGNAFYFSFLSSTRYIRIALSINNNFSTILVHSTGDTRTRETRRNLWTAHSAYIKAHLLKFVHLFCGVFEYDSLGWIPIQFDHFQNAQMRLAHDYRRPLREVGSAELVHLEKTKKTRNTGKLNGIKLFTECTAAYSIKWRKKFACACCLLRRDRRTLFSSLAAHYFSLFLASLVFCSRFLQFVDFIYTRLTVLMGWRVSLIRIHSSSLASFSIVSSTAYGGLKAMLRHRWLRFWCDFRASGFHSKMYSSRWVLRLLLFRL